MEREKYIFPPLSLLQKGTARKNDANEIMGMASKIKEVLLSFGINSKIVGISIGTRNTRYELALESRKKAKGIIRIKDDIRLCIPAMEVEYPIIGHGTMGIWVQNKVVSSVALRDLVESKSFREFPSNTAFAVGKDISGKTVVKDIEKMVSLLIGRMTGSGKSVCIDALIMSIIYKAHPNDVKMIMIDTRGTTLTLYDGIPHLHLPVITDSHKALAALQYVMAEIRDRYYKFSDYNVKNYIDYNKKNQTEQLPKILVIIDDFSDLMAMQKKEAENLITQITEHSRATGVRMIISTQRPSSEVITGRIKSNILNRISFSVFSAIDSRVILDEKGAEKLTGNGDMLLKINGRPLERIQGAYVSPQEITSVVDFLKNQCAGNIYVRDDARIKKSEKAIEKGTPLSEYFIEAAKLVVEKDKASVGMLQREFKVGFNTAARIMVELCQYGIVGKEQGIKPRKILMSWEQLENFIENKL